MTASRPLGVGLTPLETRRDVVLHVATRAEQLGYDAVFVAEGWGHDASVLPTEIALRTSRIRLGTGVLNVWGRSAASIAMLAATLDEVSGGRFTLGLGAGSPQLAEGLHDTAFDDPVGRLASVLRQVRGLVDGERHTPSGAWTHRPLRLATAPRPGLEIHAAALGCGRGRRRRRARRRLVPVPAAGVRPRRADRPALRRRGARRPPGAAHLPVHPGGGLARPGGLAGDRLLVVAFYLTRMGPLYRRTLRRLGFATAVDEVVAAGATPEVPPSADVLLDELTLWGDATAGRAGLDRWFAAGAQMPVLALPPHRSVDELDHILESLRPSVEAVP